jgi:hypothetical protein
VIVDAQDLRQVYELLREAGALTVGQVAEATGLSNEQVDLIRVSLIRGGLAENGKNPPLGDRRFTTKL